MSAAEMIHVAFIIAGSPRSFIFPAVHESIRVNLISAFCPIDTCSADIFVRVSLSDNTHEQSIYGGGVKDSRGIHIAGQDADRPLIKHGLLRLVADRNDSHGAISEAWVDVGTVAEREEMKAHFNSSRHRVFRELDPRRYSMYFGRWSAFQQARSYEREHGLRYAWFVHTRFDMAFGAPIQRYSHFSLNKVWVPNSWPLDVPDIFALIPAKFAAAYYSMDTLVQEGVMCLGGPNFNLTILNPEHLKTIGFSSELVNLALQNACRSKEWGYSENILKRKLTTGGVSLRLGTLDYEPIFSVLIRTTFRGFCAYLHPDHHLGWIWDTHTTNSAFYSGCVSMLQQFRDLHLHNRYLDCDPMPLMSQAPYTGDCMLNYQISEFNYMPFRIRLPRQFGGDCLTVNDTVELTFKPCIAYERIARHAYRINGSYSISQLFYLHPKKKSKQYIGHNRYTKAEEDHVCIFRTKVNHAVELESCALKEKKPVQMMRIRNRKRISNGRKLRVVFIYGKLCLGYSIKSPISGLVWLKCPLKGKVEFDRKRFGITFELERTN